MERDIKGQGKRKEEKRGEKLFLRSANDVRVDRGEKSVTGHKVLAPALWAIRTSEDAQ